MNDVVVQRQLPVLPNFLAIPANPLRAIVLGWVLTLSGSLLLAFVADLIFPAAPPPDFEGLEGGMAIFMLVLFAPLVETLIMATVLFVLQLFLKPAVAVVVSCVLWGVAHSLAAPTWGLVIWWPFLIFSAQFVVWRTRNLGLALFIPFATHALQNSLPAILIANGIAA